MLFCNVLTKQFRNEKKERKFAIENATKVASWTKKIMIERQLPDVCGNEIYVPEVRSD